MNDQLQKALAVALDKATDAVSAGVSFLQAELPDVIRQLLLWKFTEAVFYAAITGLVLTVWLVVGYRVTKKINNKVASDSRGFPWTIYVILSFFIVFPLSLSLVSNVRTALQIQLAPKIYLIEYAAKLAKKEQ